MAALLPLFLELAVFAAWICRAGTSQAKGLAAQLGEVEERCRSGAVDWRQEPYRGGAMEWRQDSGRLPPQVVVALDEAWGTGLPLGASIAAFRIVLARGDAAWRAARELQLTLLVRAATAVGVAAVARVGLAAWRFGDSSGPTLTPSLYLDVGLDRSALVLAGALIAVASVGLALLLPRSWLLGPTGADLTPEAAAWLASHLAGEVCRGGPAAAELVDLALRELTAGVGLLGEKRRVLAAYAEERAGEADQRRARLCDALPAFELAGAGLPAALILLEPLVRALG